WNAMTRRNDIVGLDAAILMHPMVWKASGHVDGFSDPLVDCKECKTRFRADNTDSYINDKKCPNCGSKNLSEERSFNLMFKTRLAFYLKFGIKAENLKFKPHEKLAHYAKAAVDVEFKFPMGFSELEGIHNRSDFDLSQHMKFSGKSLEYFDEANKEKFIPYVI